MTDVSGISTYKYDSSDRLIQVVKPNGTLSYAYDAANRLSSLAVGSTQYGYTYDVLNRLSGVTAPNSGTSSPLQHPIGSRRVSGMPDSPSLSDSIH